MKSESIQLDSAYERALVKMNLKVEYGVDNSDSLITVPIQVVREAVTIPLPKAMLATLP